MPRYILLNRRAGLFTDAAKHASRATVATALSRLAPHAKIHADHNPSDPLARRVVVFEADAAHVDTVRPQLPTHTLVEELEFHAAHARHPTFLRTSKPQPPHASARHFTASVVSGRTKLQGVPVTVFFADAAGHHTYAQAMTDGDGLVSVPVPPGHSIAVAQPTPYAGYWPMVAEAPATGAAINCPAVPHAGPDGDGWWHHIMGVNTAAGHRGRGIKVGVIDTGCGPHRNLAHVNRIGAFTGGRFQTGALAAADVSDHGTHTTGIIGARPSKHGDYAGMAPDCTLFHIRVFKDETPKGIPSSADLVNAIDALSRDHGCDLINMSLGAKRHTLAVQDAIRDAAERGTMCICSAGNDAGAVEYPAAYPDCAAVSAIGQLGCAPPGSLSASFRPHPRPMHGRDHLFLAAFSCIGEPGAKPLTCCGPGVGIISTVPDRLGISDRYVPMDGTSMASPAVCGALAVILGRDPGYKVLPRDETRTRAARDALIGHCHSIGMGAQLVGHGLPHAGSARA